MTTEITDKETNATSGWVFYDATCALCLAWARRMEAVLGHRRISLVALQSPGARERLGLGGDALVDEMRLLLADGRSLGGADAALEIARRIWWIWPLWLAARIPGFTQLLRAGYRALARHRHCANGVCGIPRPKRKARHHGAVTFWEMP